MQEYGVETTGPTATEVTPRRSALRSPRWWSWWLLVLLLGILVAAVPLPVMVFSPQPPRPIEAMIRVEGAPRPPSGQLLAASVGYRQGTPALALWALLDPGRALVPMDQGERRPPGDAIHSFDDSVIAAAAVGLRLAGHDVPVTSRGLEVTDVVEGLPAAEVLQAGDLLVEADGRTLVLPSDLRAITSAAAVGDRVALRLRRDGRELTLEVGVGSLGADGGTVIGVHTRALGVVVSYPPGISVTGIDDAEGGSAGLPLALAVYDRFADEPLLAGRRVAGTGTIDLDGGVHPIDGIAQKVHGAAAADVDVFLAPSAQYDEARAAAGDDLVVVRVGTVREAIDALAEATG